MNGQKIQSPSGGDSLTRRKGSLLVFGIFLLLWVSLVEGAELPESVPPGWDEVLLERRGMAAFLERLGPWAPWAFIGLQAFQVLVAFIPGEVTGVVGGYAFGRGLGFLYSTVGLFIGSLLAFLIARAYGRRLIERVVPKETMAKFDWIITKKGITLATFILFLIPGFPKDYLCYLLGLSAQPLWIFLVTSTLGRMPGTILLTTYGETLQLSRFNVLLTLLVIVGIIILLAARYRGKVLGWLGENPSPGGPKPPPPAKSL